MMTPISSVTSHGRGLRTLPLLMCVLAFVGWLSILASPSPAGAQLVDPNDCGDAVVDPNNGEECEAGDPNTADACCTTECQFESPGAACAAPGANPTCDPQDECDDSGHCVNMLGDPNVECQDPNTVTTCDPMDYCSGTGDCPGVIADPNTTCQDPNTVTTCDPMDYCSGTGECAPSYAIRTPCQDPNTVTVCDPMDYCSGTGDCPAVLADPNTACQDPNTVTTCDPMDYCSGTGGCPIALASPATPCGDPNDTDCDDPDICDGAGNCDDRLVPDGVPCTDTSSGAGGDCYDAQCDGSGACDPNHATEAMDTPCGDPNDTECDDPDTCGNFDGVCHTNWESNTTECTDTSSGSGGDCKNAMCTGTGNCNQDGPDESAGTACGDRSTNTICDGLDTCDPNGICDDNWADPNTQCTDTSSGAGGDCWDAQCDGSGVCDPNAALEAPGTACGDRTINTICDAADTCDPNGICGDNWADPNTPCETDDDICTSDLCDATGTCEHTFLDVDEDDVCDPIENSCLPGDGVDTPFGRQHTSLPTATGLGCVRVTTDCAQHRDVRALTEEQASPPDGDPDYGYAYGLVHFVLEGCQSNQANVTLTYDAATDISALILRKHGPVVPDGSPNVFYTVSEVVGPVTMAGNQAQFTLTNNQPGDDTMDPNRIIDQVGPAAETPPAPAPALGPWGLAASLLVLLGVAFRAVRRRRSV